MRKSRGVWVNPGPPSRNNTTSSIRGKISAPIPLADDEFPMRSPRAGVTAPLGHGDVEKQPPKTASLVQVNTTDEEEKEFNAAQEPTLPSPAPSEELSTPPARQVSPPRASGVSDPSGAHLGKPQRKKSTLRTVFGRIFGKKHKSGSSVSVLYEEPGRANGHRSDPTALRRPNDQALSPQRSASTHINDYNRALRSHSPFSENKRTTAFESIRDYKDLDGKTRLRQSAAPSKLYEPAKTPGYVNWTGLSPRPASSHARSSGAFAEDTPRGSIGFAVTSGSHPNRRSRSLGELPAVETEYGVRRRSDEIRYWRESYDPDAMSPMSSHYRPETQGNDQSQESEVPEVPQPFNFGLMGEMAGMKITQAASLETRVSRLEARLEELEKAFVGLHGRRPSSIVQQNSSSRQYGFSSPGMRPGTDSSEQSLPRFPPNRMYMQVNNPQADTSYRFQAQSNDTSRPSTDSTHNSYYQSYEELSPRPALSSSTEQARGTRLLHSNISALQSESMGRPLSTSTTIRANASSSPLRTPPDSNPLSKTGSLTAHHYTALMNLISVEQTAREVLETQFTALQQQVQSLLSNTPTKKSNADATARPDSVAYPKAMGMTGEFSSFEHEESGSESETSGYDDGTETIYQTPSEERSHFGTQDEYEHEISDLEDHDNPRTMSLSQLTMGKSTVGNSSF